MNFWNWFDELRNGTPILELELSTNAPRGRIYNSYQKRIPTALVCQTIAAALGISEQEVLSAAGHISPPRKRSEIYQQKTERLEGIIHRLSEENLQYIYDLARWRLEQQKNEGEDNEH